MAMALQEPPLAVKDGAPTGALELVRIHFVTSSPPDDTVVRRFVQPRSAHAEKAALPAASLKRTASTLEDATALIVFVAPDAGNSVVANARAELAGEAGEPPRLTVKQGSDRVEWWPGRALVQAPVEARETIRAALVDFMFYEGELRELERRISLGEEQAHTDLGVSHRIHPRDRERWRGLVETQESFSRARLLFARLEPELSSDLSALAPPARRWLERLYEDALVEDRAEALNDRLETLEDFYEGATQRVADFRWYREGRLLETTIIAILVLECLLMAGDIYLHFAR